jgi:hypothetical protein
MMRRGAIKGPQMLTGYGSHLLIMGLPLNNDLPEDMVGVDDVRHSNN